MIDLQSSKEQIRHALRFEQINEACPEQYQVYIDFKGKELVTGFVRLRHGLVSVRYPDMNGDLIYETRTIGDGCFDSAEEKSSVLSTIRLTLAEAIRKDWDSHIKEK